MIKNDSAEVKHSPRQASDHAMIQLDSKPIITKTKARFIWEVGWAKEHVQEEMVKEVWNQEVDDTRSFKVKQKLKWCKNNLIKWRKEKNAMLNRR